MTRNRLMGALACLAAFSIGAGGTLAYLTDHDSTVNTFTVGNVKIDLEEPSWPTEDEDEDGVPDEAEDLVPNEELDKDPQVVNQGANDAMVFIRVTVPVADVTMVTDEGYLVKSLDEDGNVLEYYGREDEVPASGAHFPQELFFFKAEEDPAASHKNHFNTLGDYASANGDGGYWIELKDQETFEKLLDDGTTKTDYNTENQVVGQRVYVFGYNRVLAEAEDDVFDRTQPLFEKVQLKNIIENEISTEELQQVKVEAFAIQADNILIDEAYLTGYDDLTDAKKLQALNDVYEIYVNQNGTFDDEGNMIRNKEQ